MSIITFPSTLKVSGSRWAQVRRDLAFSGPFGSQATELDGPLWEVMIGAPDMLERDAGEWQALLMLMRGQTNQLALWNHGRSAPRGTMRGTMTLNTAAAQGAVALSIIAATEAATTLKAGDYLGLGTGVTQQVVMVTADATANGSGVIAISIEPPLRNAHLIAAAVTWDKPKALFRRKQSAASWDYKNVTASGLGLDLIEDTRA
ncbi:MAG: hypothetical protein B7Y56_03005 [Gallionellales bacterium 35-53-114]|jgi:hypothetical protein|nr:MAG: hypothetical protein B7Y56_03005 [Gallionellales bacterium 35-53-114]OYZ65076.1 MAG: hypothetical protein B7Y04_00165 [Gallionellales bacterium 24-53-125]OZB07985.1 MAG: hypothetical protein B7X61_10615 [Gallionellales bacterium 39-52-133]HQS59725.1 hypothetical protein [Gallionellaceae bacterium]HQS76479.1 hypothetical protein [Gallionellaceae bacterium]